MHESCKEEEWLTSNTSPGHAGRVCLACVAALSEVGRVLDDLVIECGKVGIAAMVSQHLAISDSCIKSDACEWPEDSSCHLAMCLCKGGQYAGRSLCTVMPILDCFACSTFIECKSCNHGVQMQQYLDQCWQGLVPGDGAETGDPCGEKASESFRPCVACAHCEYSCILRVNKP